MSRILITAGTGLLGKALGETVPKEHDVFATYYPIDNPVGLNRDNFHFLDIRDKRKVFDLFAQTKPNVVIHTASLGSVDYCEKNREIAWETNVKGTINILSACEKDDIKIIYISSNAVFDRKHPPYGEEDPVNPINYYGKLKVEAERIIKEGVVSWAIVRPILMYGWHNPNERSNHATWLIQKLEQKEEVTIVTDIYSNPLLSINCAQAIWAVVKGNKEGIYHIAGGDCLSRYDFALETAEVFNLEPSLIKPVKNVFFKGIASRPKNTCYRTVKMERELKIRPLGIQEGLTFMKEHS